MHDSRCAEWYQMHVNGGGTLSWERIAEQYEGLNGNTIKKRVRKWRDGNQQEAPQGESPVPSPVVAFPDLKRKAEPGWGLDFLDKISDVQDTLQSLDTQQNVAHAVIETDLPVGVIFPGDFHLGGRGTNHRLMKQDMLMWKTLGNAVKVVGMGDYSEQFTGKLAKIGLSQHVMTNDMQIETVMDVFCTALKDQWLTFLEGNHDGWAGAELARYVMRMAQRCGVPFLGKGGELYLTGKGHVLL